MKFLITGDTHGDFSRFLRLPFNEEEKKNLGIIILGDACLNFYGGMHLENPKDKRDELNKKKVEKLGITFYCVRGNHEFDPGLLEDIKLEFDKNVNGFVFYQPKFPHIKYFQIWGTYIINNLKTLVIGGAYSVDKDYRIASNMMWYPKEQMNAQEQMVCWDNIKDKEFDLILTHTCPYNWRSTDLFLPYIDQEKVDTSTEKFLQMVADAVPWRTWCWGHYHDDREVLLFESEPGRNCYMFYENIQLLEEIV